MKYLSSAVKILFLIATLNACSNVGKRPESARASLSHAAVFEDSASAPLIERIQNAKQVYTSLINSADQRVPSELLDKTKCVAVIPNVIKAAFLVGGRYGEGIASCRDVYGNWSAPAFMTITGGSFGWQIGAQSTDLVLYFMDEKSAQSLLESNVTLGGDVSVAAGPLGRTAGIGTDTKLTGIFSYAQTEGFFAGISLEGAVLSPNDRANTIFYSKVVSPRDVLFNSNIESIPPVAKEFVSLLP